VARYTYTSDDPKDPNYRLSIEEEGEDDDGTGYGLITIAEESTTSAAITAQTTGIRGAVDLTTEQAKWLYFALGKMLLSRGGLDPNGIHGVSDKEANRRRPVPKSAALSVSDPGGEK